MTLADLEALVLGWHADKVPGPILADALEEAGCPEEVMCRVCGGEGYIDVFIDRLDEEGGLIGGTMRPHREDCPACVQSATPGRVPNPLLALLRGQLVDAADPRARNRSGFLFVAQVGLLEANHDGE